MDFGICVASRPADLPYIQLAESLGYTHCWMGDSQMLWSDVYAMLALAAERTTTMRIGTGVAVASTRPAPVTAAALATINQLAPGRVFCGIGTGNTAMRIMGHKPMPLAEFDEYLETLRPLLSGGEVSYRWRGKRAPIHHLMPDAGFVNFSDPIPLYVSAFGPRAMGIAARQGDGMITSVPPDPAAVARVRAALAAAKDSHSHSFTRSTFPLSTLTTVLVLQPGERLSSERVRRQTGAFAIAALHYAYEQWVQFGRRPGHQFDGVWDDYVELVETAPPGRRHLRIHAGHNCWVEPDEAHFVTPELISRTCLVGRPDDLAERIRALETAGLDQLVILPPLAEKEAVIREFAEQVIPLLTAEA
ncbi:MAG: LLM class flavin-dependent oxidoreductase [Ilumatobacteraceae bacterium]